MVEFSECDPPASNSEIVALEERLGFRIPSEIRDLVGRANGGRPTPSIFRGSVGSTDVSECLALRDAQGSIEWTYNQLVRNKKATPSHYLPFAIDSGGNTFFVDCDSPEQEVYLLLHDPQFKLLPLDIGLRNFWGSLETELSANP